MSVVTWWQHRTGGRVPAGYGTPLVLSPRRIYGIGYGVHLLHAPPGGGPCLRSEATWRNVAGVVVSTSRGSAWLFFRRWQA